MKVRYRTVIQEGTGLSILVSDEDIKKGEKFLYLKKDIIVAKNDINVHDNPTHFKIITAKLIQTELYNFNPGDTFQVKFRGRNYKVEEYVRSTTGNNYCIASSQKILYAFFHDKIVYYEKRK